MLTSLFLLPPPPPPPPPPFFLRRTAVVSSKFRPTSAIPPPRLRRIAAPRCATQGGWEGSPAELELGRLEENELGRLEENCGRSGAVEMLECLEREAIMGEDEGRDPNDYNRRAKIFSTSSRVFQALKQQQQHSEDEHEEEDKVEHVH